MSLWRVSILLALAALPPAAGCRHAAGGTSVTSHAPVRFVDVTREAGIHFRHTSGRSGRNYLAETMGSGCAFLDYDGDGQTDLLITAYGGSHLFLNDHGRFTEVTRQAGINGPAWGTSAAWFDYDRDGALDLFICNYLQWSPETNRVCGEKGLRYACPPSYYPSTASVLYHNNGHGTFTDVTRRAKVDSANGKALGVVVWDMDDDGWPDFAVANDSEPNWLFHNNRDGTFTEIGVETGVAYGSQGRQRSGTEAST